MEVIASIVVDSTFLDVLFGVVEMVVFSFFCRPTASFVKIFVRVVFIVVFNGSLELEIILFSSMN